jgi:exopolyphosphatase/guanosine-5'-triphosphate,3'-diphosphate pyrophosphatase
MSTDAPGMPTTAPRWEWRCFAPPGTILPHVVSIPSEAVPRESDETYILDLEAHSSQSVKIRDGALDVKRLLRTDSNALELWEPLLKARFPLGREEVAAIFEPPAALTRESYTFEQFISDVVAPQPTLRIVEVRKCRRSFTFAGCLAEFVDVRADGASMQSFALEHEDPKRLLAALHILGFDPHANTNYAIGLKRALGLAANVRADVRD